MTPALHAPPRAKGLSRWIEAGMPARTAMWAAVLTIAVLFLRMASDQLSQYGLFSYVAADFRVWWSVSEVSAHDGLSHMYDLPLLEDSQRHLLAEYGVGAGKIPVGVYPMPYQAIFATPFTALRYVSPVTGMWCWLGLSLAGYSLYLRRLARALGARLTPLLFASALVCLPFMLDLFFTQVNLWLAICVGEALIAAKDGKEARAGLWLGGLLMKPQALLLIGIGLLLARRTRALLGLGAAGAVVGLGSLVLVGPQGLREWLSLIGDYKAEFGSFPDTMINWRMLGINLQSFGKLSATTSSTVAYAGMALTAAAAGWCWLGNVRLSGPNLPLRLLATYAATCAFAWHAHVDMALPLIALLLVLRQRGELPPATLETWVILPSAAFLLGGAPPHHVRAALVLFVLNLALVAIVLAKLWRGPADDRLLRPREALRALESLRCSVKRRPLRTV